MKELELFEKDMHSLGLTICMGNDFELKIMKGERLIAQVFDDFYHILDRGIERVEYYIQRLMAGSYESWATIEF